MKLEEKYGESKEIRAVKPKVCILCGRGNGIQLKKRERVKAYLCAL